MATAFVAGVRQALSGARAIAGQLGLHPFSVSLVTKGWSGTDTGRGTATETVVPILVGGQNPKVRSVSERRIALGIGLEAGDLTVGPITPEQDATWSVLLQQAMVAKTEILVRITHTESGEANDYRIYHVDTDSALHTMLTLKPVSTGT